MQSLKNFFQITMLDISLVFMIIINQKVIMPQTDTYIEKDTEINEKIEQMRLESTSMLLSGEPTIISGYCFMYLFT